MSQEWISVSAERGVRKSPGWDALMAKVAAGQLARISAQSAESASPAPSVSPTDTTEGFGQRAAPAPDGRKKPC